jgi:voltage-gated potassium channel
VGGEASVRRTLLVRVGVVLALFLAVVVLFWVDREGLRDNLDSHISLVDVVYFSMVTVTTVGYGDIVPVSPRARLVDALLVTPIRLFIWLIFLGTAYQLVLQRLIEDIRMRRLQADLQDHVVICGFGHSGRSAAREMTSRGIAAGRVLVIDPLPAALEQAAEAGYIGLLGDATHEETLRRARVETARAVLVCTGRDDTTVLIVLTVRHLYPAVRIVAMVQEEENEKLVRHSGASATVLPSYLGGLLMADSLEDSSVVEYVMDLVTAAGRVMLTERVARSAEVGRHAREVEDGLVLRIHRGDRVIGFWEPEARVEDGDRLVLIVHQ